jgi:Fic-DOC domain mobile mystery protein B
MDRLFGADAGQTPLDPDDLAGLRLGFIATRGELDAAEQSNVAKAITWSRVRRPTPDRILDEPFVRGLHRRMFGDVWSWAGRYRKTSRNLGIDPWLISEGIGALLGDARHWLEIGDDQDAVCVRVHHRLVQVHPFANGNGRHARLYADLLVVGLGAQLFTWGALQNVDAATIRSAYISALHAADAGDLASLIAFART